MPNPESSMAVFSFEGLEIRVLGSPSDPRWVASDVCAALGIQNPRDTMSRVPDDEKGVGQTDTLGGPQEVAVLRESGLFRVIFRSDKPEAERLRRFVFHEVLPAIRRTGSYGASPELEARIAALEERLPRPPRPRTLTVKPDRPLQTRHGWFGPPSQTRERPWRQPRWDPDSEPVPPLRRRVRADVAPLLRELLCALRDTVGTEGIAVADGFARAPRLALALRAFGNGAQAVGITLSLYRGFRHENLVLDYGRAKRTSATFDAPSNRTAATWRARVAPPEAKPTAPRDRFLFADVPTAAELDLAASD